ncbi:MAG: family 43 glycosylhydrolase, partial [Oscillospiraceae bacterium]|nr:family 43 glycosylhydrolase [Oscillospiraceae bacterium]
SRAFVPGEQFSFSANVCYTSGAATDTFYMKLQYVDASGETMYDSIAEGTAIQGEWLQLANTNYTIPAGATDLQLYIETADSTVSFYVDEAIGAVAGTKIDGPGQSGFMLGDLDSDGMITGTDLAMAKRGMMKGFDSNGDKLAADVDQSGVVDAADMTYLAQYLSCQITEFPVAERVVDFAKMDQLFSSINLTSSLKKDNENNALYTQRFGADPGFMVYKDRLYVYMTNDAFEYDGNGNLKENSYDVQEINCISSSDLVNWTDHGAIPVAGGSGAARWAYASWAPDACWKTINGKDKFFLYFANSAGGIGVLTADSPTGPWTDPIGKALVTKQTPNCGDVEWMFDPGVFVDDDGTGYLYFGGGVPSGKAADPGTARVVKLGADMISLDGTPARINPPYLFEDSSILKIGNTYYYSYCTNFNVPGGQAFGSGEICYMTSNNPMGPFTYAGRMFKNPASFGLDGGGNNHHSFVEFKGKYYLLYHARAIERRMNVSLNYRSPHIDVANVSNGSITVTGTMTGVSQLESLNPYEVVQAETMAQQAGINVSGVGNTVVSDISAGDWIKLKGVDFGNGCTKLTVRVSSTSGAAIKVCTGGPSGKAFGYVEIPAGTTMSEITVPVNSVSGVNDLCFVFSGALQFDTWCFS